MKIEVTQTDIDRGRPGSPDFCPVARAIKRRVRGKRVSVAAFEIWIGARQVYSPNKVHRFVQRFDSRKIVHPFSFVIPDEAFVR